jgi:processive 1,2-diacylglycerol beta-glucosyltransferase
VNPIPGQEERNADHLLQAGAAIRGNNLPALALPALAWKLDRLLDDAARLEAMRKNARRLSRPGAAAEIVSELAWGSSPAGFRPGETGA